MTRIRIISAVVATLIVIGLIYFFREAGVGILAAIIAVLSLAEFAAIVFSGKNYQSTRWVFVIVGMAIFGLGFYYSGFLLPGISIGMIVMMAAHLIAAKNEKLSLQELAAHTGLSVWGLVYAAVSPLYIYFLAIAAPNLLWFFFTAVVVFSGDIAAYFFGVRFGKTRLYPRISPKKSVEGAIASVFASVVAGIAFKLVFIPDLALFWALAISLCLSVAAQTGDLCESLLKRAYNAKDSGTIMPGHGGILDRLDGVFFAVPVVYVFIIWLKL